MEALWIVAGILLGGGVGYVAARVGRPSGAEPDRETLASRVKSLEADVERLRLDFQDTLDKISHLYDRVRKRLQVEQTPLTPAGNGAEAPVSFADRKAAIRARARMGGLLK